MKIQTNFIVAAQRHVGALRGGAWVGAVLLVLLALWLVLDARAMRAQLGALREQAARLDAAAVAAPSAASLRADDQARARLERLNALARGAGVNSAALLSELEALLPAPAWLVRLHYRAAEGELQLVAAAHTVAPLSDFLLRLEQSALFERVLLLRELQPGASAAGSAGQGSVQFEIRCKVRS